MNKKFKPYLNVLIVLVIYFLITGAFIALIFNLFGYHTISLLDGMVFSAIIGALKAHLSNQLFIVLKMDDENSPPSVLFFVPKISDQKKEK